MHNRALHDTLAAFVEEAAQQLAAEVADGAEIPFELMDEGRGGRRGARGPANFYCYRPLVGEFVAGRSGMLARLPSHAAAVGQLAALPSPEGYLVARGERPPRGERRVLAEAVLTAFLAALWSDATDFAFEPTRFARAYAELEAAAYDGCSITVVVAPVEGLVIESDEVPLGDGLTLARAAALGDAPLELRGDAFTTVAVLALEGLPGADAGGLEDAGRRLRRLQTALRLWDDAEPAVGPLAWARTDDSPWLQVPLTGGLRRMGGDCLLTAEEEDPLRGFCSLVARRTPRAGELAWALRRFELGCERPSGLEALTDWLLAARALLGDPAGGGDEPVVDRLAAICAAPEEREGLRDCLWDAVALERSAVAGLVRADPEVEALVADLGGALRAVLRDVLCGHLDLDLRAVADRLIAAAERDATSELPALG